MRCVFVLSAVLLLCGAADAGIRVVHPDGSGEWPTIQAAVEASAAGDVVELTAGTFAGAGNRDVDFLGKSITIRSQGGNPLDCIVDCEGTEDDPHRGFLFCSGEGAGSVLEGLTIANGMAWQETNGHQGGGVYCGVGASPVVVNCRFVGNVASGPPGGGAGGGVACLDDSAPVFVSCAFIGNGAYFGGAIDCCGIGSALSLTECVFHGNQAYMGGGINCSGSTLIADECTFSGSYGFALSCWHGSVVLENCTFYGNSDGALYFAYQAVPSLDNTLVAFNSGSLWCEDVIPALSCCDIYGNGGGDWVFPFDDQLGINGNVSEDPLFCSTSPEDDLDWSIHSDSPCAPASSGCGLMGAWGVGCGDSPVRPCTWGGLKATYLRRRSARD